MSEVLYVRQRVKTMRAVRWDGEPAALLEAVPSLRFPPWVKVPTEGWLFLAPDDIVIGWASSLDGYDVVEE